MAAVEVTISGVLYDKYNRTQQNVVLFGEAVITGLQVGGGPIMPPPGGGGGEGPPGIWGPPGPWPTPPIHLPPGQGGVAPPGAHPMPPIYYPPNVPPELTPPTPPAPGTVTPIPPPPGSPGWPTQGMVPPQYIVVNYPGFGPVVVTQPPHAEPAS